MANDRRAQCTYIVYTIQIYSIHMGLLIFWSLLMIPGTWYIIYVYSNKWIATLVTTVIVLVCAILLDQWISKPTPEEIREHTYKTLHV